MLGEVQHSLTTLLQLITDREISVLFHNNWALRATKTAT